MDAGLAAGGLVFGNRVAVVVERGRGPVFVGQAEQGQAGVEALTQVAALDAQFQLVALARLEQEGLVQTIPRGGVFVVRKTKQEIIEITWNSW